MGRYELRISFTALPTTVSATWRRCWWIGKPPKKSWVVCWGWESCAFACPYFWTCTTSIRWFMPVHRWHFCRKKNNKHFIIRIELWPWLRLNSFEEPAVVSRHFHSQPRFPNHIFEHFPRVSHDISHCVYLYQSRGSIDLVSRMASRIQSHAKTKKIPYRGRAPPLAAIPCWTVCMCFDISIKIADRDWYEEVLNRYPWKKLLSAVIPIYTYIRLRTKDAGNMSSWRVTRSRLMVRDLRLGRKRLETRITGSHRAQSSCLCPAY